ncbi:uncharacterized protein [Hoplias malabaricus]|uniref:uncharacterized protein n=1 Tax=Hoplias malabaricus TaxID=27720 RepID=UPI003462A96A
MESPVSEPQTLRDGSVRICVGLRRGDADRLELDTRAGVRLRICVGQKEIVEKTNSIINEFQSLQENYASHVQINKVTMKYLKNPIALGSCSIAEEIAQVELELKKKMQEKQVEKQKGIEKVEEQKTKKTHKKEKDRDSFKGKVGGFVVQMLSFAVTLLLLSCVAFTALSSSLTPGAPSTLILQDTVQSPLSPYCTISYTQPPPV